ncbi:MAG: IclR family transcriptional regulator [Pseudomonadales bacterium]
MDSSRKQTYAAPALTKGLDILEMMAAEPAALSLREIADKLGRSKSEIFRMLVVLDERGYIKFDSASEKYAMSLKLFEVAHQHSAVKKLTAIAGPLMEELVNTIGQSCHLAIREGGKALVIAQQDTTSQFRFGVKLGLEVPLTNTCSGHLFLTYNSPAERKKMLSQQPKHLKQALSAAALKKITNDVESRGYEILKSQQVHGVTDIGFPVFDSKSTIVASLVVPFLEHLDGSHHMNLDTAKGHLQDTAKAISTLLGH